MRDAVPPMDHLARALLMRGAREPAIMLLKAAARRGGDEKVRCDALLAAVQARPHDRVSGPPLTLDGTLVEAVAAAGRLYEARALALGADLARTVAGVEIAAALEEVFDSVDDWPVGWRMRWLDGLASGSLAAMTAIEREVSVASDSPPPLKNRVRIALRLLRGFSLTSATEVREPDGEVVLPELAPEVREKISARIRASDLPGALREAHALAFDGVAGVPEVAALLGRLVAATEHAMNEPSTAKLASTVPLGGPGMALFQLRMGNLTESQRLFRNMLLENPQDHSARQYLADLGALERALSGGRPQAMPEPPSRAPSTGVLDKRARKANVEGWAVAAKPAAQEPSWSDDDDSTSVMKSDHEAELLIKSGHPERALVLYRELVRNFPGKPAFAKRMAEVEQMVVARQAAPLAVEPTVRRDVSPLLAGKRSIDPLAQTGDSGAFEEPDPTAVMPSGRGVAALLAPPQKPAPIAPPAAPTPTTGVAASRPRPRSEPSMPASRPQARQAEPSPAVPASRPQARPPEPSAPSQARPPEPSVPSSRPQARPPEPSAPSVPSSRPQARPEPSAVPSSRPQARPAEPAPRESSVSVHRLGPSDLPEQVTVRKIVPVG